MIGEQSVGASFLQLSGLIAGVVDGNEELAIDRIRYDSTRNLFVMAIRSESDAGIENFRRALANVGVTADDNGGYRRAGNAWVGEMTARMQ